MDCAETMGDVSQTKTCPLCAETIKAAAKVCPFCQGRQGRFGLWREQWPPIVSGVLLLVVVFWGCFWLLPDVPASGRSFTAHRDELRVLRTSVEREKQKPEFWLIGCVTNTGDYPWRVHELELRFLDAQGNLLDMRRAVLSDPFVVPPSGENAFRVGLGDLAFTNRGVVHQVRVQTATDGNLPPKS